MTQTVPHVISASRRTDIPGFYSEWFVNRLKAGFVYVQQPFNNRVTRVSLKAKDVSAIFFWSKNYRPLLEQLETVERTTRNLFFHYTITANRELEQNTPDYREAIRDYIFIARRHSPNHIVWRFDPICLTDKQSFETHEERFARCAELLRGHARGCIISFAHPYKKVLANFRKYTDHTPIEAPAELKREYAARLADRAEKFGIMLSACCNDYLLSNRIRKASCINGRLLSELFTVPIDTRSAATRKECGCTRSMDIGAYGTCAHGCIYCYANVDKERAKSAKERHDPSWNSLRMNVQETDMPASTEAQASFFEGGPEAKINEASPHQ